MPFYFNENRDNLLNIPINIPPKIKTNERQFERQEPLNWIPNSLQLQLRELAQIAWTTEDSFRYPQFLLNPNDLAQITTPSTVVEVLLRHVERIGLSSNQGDKFS